MIERRAPFQHSTTPTDMKLSIFRQIPNLTLFSVVVCLASLESAGQEILVRPSRGGGMDTNAPMIHVDIFYDYDANKMHANLDISHGVPHMLPLPVGYSFAASSNYSVLNGKAYSLQYAWNPGGVFAPPANAAVWIECIDASPGLENYDGHGNKNENPPRPYTPILGTAGSPKLWRWYGRMAHNAYAILNPTDSILTATYRVFFGDETTGARDAFREYGDAIVTLTWTVDPVPEPLVFRFGAVSDANPSPLAMLNAEAFTTKSGYAVNMAELNTGSQTSQFGCEIPMIALPATESNGGPEPGHAALGACLELEVLSLDGPVGGRLSFCEPGQQRPSFEITAGRVDNGLRIRLSDNDARPGADPYGRNEGRRFIVDRAGLYRLGFRVVDVSANGANGEPLHSPSEVYHVYLQAGLTADSIVREGTAAITTFVGAPNANFYLERTAGFEGAGAWQTVAGPLRGMSRVQKLVDLNANGTRHFYRLRMSVP